MFYLLFTANITNGFVRFFWRIYVVPILLLVLSDLWNTQWDLLSCFDKNGGYRSNNSPMIKKSVFQTFWKTDSYTNFLSLELNTSNGYLLSQDNFLVKMEAPSEMYSTHCVHHSTSTSLTSLRSYILLKESSLYYYTCLITLA